MFSEAQTRIVPPLWGHQILRMHPKVGFPCARRARGDSVVIDRDRESRSDQTVRAVRTTCERSASSTFSSTRACTSRRAARSRSSSSCAAAASCNTETTCAGPFLLSCVAREGLRQGLVRLTALLVIRKAQYCPPLATGVLTGQEQLGGVPSSQAARRDHGASASAAAAMPRAPATDGQPWP